MVDNYDPGVIVVRSYRYVPTGWDVDEGDPSVGIFGMALWHTCDQSELLDDPTADVELADVVRDGVVTYRTLHVCRGCGASFATETQ